MDKELVLGKLTHVRKVVLQVQNNFFLRNYIKGSVLLSVLHSSNFEADALIYFAAIKINF